MDDTLAKALANLDWCIAELKEAKGYYYYTEQRGREDVDLIEESNSWLIVVDEIEHWMDEVRSNG